MDFTGVMVDITGAKRGTFCRLVNGGPAMFDDTRGYIMVNILLIMVNDDG